MVVVRSIVRSTLEAHVRTRDTVALQKDDIVAAGAEGADLDAVASLRPGLEHLENVILDGEGRVKLVDFGSAAYIKSGPFDVFVGTIGECNLNV